MTLFGFVLGHDPARSGATADEATERGIDRSLVYREQTTALIEGGVQVLFFETFMDFAEMATAMRATPASDCLILASFACEPEGRLQSGMLLVNAFARVRDLGARVVGVNCVNGPRAMVQLLQYLPAGDLLAAYANAGYPRYSEGRYVYPFAPDYFAAAAREMAGEGARLIGGCCGTTPAHIAAIAAAIADLRPVRSKRVHVSAAADGADTPKLQSQTEESLLD